MDELDRRIIDILKKDAETPLSRVADMLGVPRPTVYLRFNKLKDGGVIKGFGLILGNETSGRKRAAYLLVKDYLLSDMSRRTIESLGQKLAKRHEVVFAARMARDKLIVIWEGEGFDPMEYPEVVKADEIDIEVFKTP